MKWRRDHGWIELDYQGPNLRGSGIVFLTLIALTTIAAINHDPWEIDAGVITLAAVAATGAGLYLYDLHHWYRHHHSHHDDDTDEEPPR